MATRYISDDEDIYYRGDPETEPIEKVELSTSNKPTFPSAFFRENNAKPEIILPPYTGTPVFLRAGVDAAIQTGNCTIDHAVLFMWDLFQDIQATLDADWISFGQVIGRNGAVVTPRDILKPVTRTVNPIAFLEAPDITEKDRMLNAYMLMSPYRLSGNFIGDYHNILTKKFRDVMMEYVVGTNRCEPGSFALARPNWEQDPNYSKIIGALDMFLYRFPSHSLSKLRVATITSRFRDCLGLGNLDLFVRTTGDGVPRALKWIWCESVGKEIRSLLTKGEEIDNKFSYAPYYSAFKLGTRSPYPASATPMLHTFVHTVGVLMGSLRSINARMIDGSNFTEAIQHGYRVAYALSSRSEMRGMFFNPADARYNDQENLIEELGSDDEDNPTPAKIRRLEREKSKEPTVKKAGAWYLYYNSYFDCVPSHIKQDGDRRCRRLRGTRTGSMGSHLQQTIGGDV